jgi:fatty-acyl-CoA synthase
VTPIVPTAVTLPDLIADQAAATPDAPAVVAGGSRWSYRELDSAVRRSTAALASLGVGPSGRVGLLAANSADWPAIAFGAHRLGARVDAFNTWVKAWDLDHMLASSGCSVLVIVAAVRSAELLAELRKLLPELWDSAPGEWRSERFPALRHIVVLGEGDQPSGAHRWADLNASDELEDCTHEPVPDRTALVLYTSGSSAAPKAVPLLHRDLVVNGFHIGERMGLGAADRVWLGSPLFWSFGCANAMMATFTHGACLVLQEQFAAPEAAALLAAERCTAAYLLPSIVDALLPVAEQIRAVDSLRTGLTIGRPDEIRRVTDELGVAEICNVYGSTETYGNCCVTWHDAPRELRLTTQGPPLPGVDLRVIDDVTGEPRNTDATGELHVRGRITPEYLGNPEATAAAITNDGWFRTGDRVTLRPDGAVEFQSRLTEMIKTSGINVSPAEVEGYLCSHPDVAMAAVVGAPHPSRGEVVVAFVTTRGDSVDGAALRQWCREGIAGYKVPWEIVVMPQLPSTATGKILRRDLVEDATRRVQSAENTRRESRTEERSR